MRRITRMQLRKLINETVMLEQASDSKKVDPSDVVSAVLKGSAYSGGIPAVGVLVSLSLGKTLAGEAKEFYDGLDPRIKTALNGFAEAIKAVPDNMKESLILTAVEFIEGATDLID